MKKTNGELTNDNFIKSIIKNKFIIVSIMSILLLYLSISAYNKYAHKNTIKYSLKSTCDMTFDCYMLKNQMDDYNNSDRLYLYYGVSGITVKSIEIHVFDIIKINDQIYNINIKLTDDELKKIRDDLSYYRNGYHPSMYISNKSDFIWTQKAHNYIYLSSYPFETVE